MYLKRKVDTFLIQWKSSKNRMPLIVKGARQVGKTETILNFANAHYHNVIYINFALERRFLHILADGYDVQSVTKNISLVDPNKKFIPNDTIIIFDEIQAFPDIATTLKPFCMDGRFDVICSGSLLGINYKKIHSNSVGYKTDYTMHSMDFEEYLWAKGYDGSIVDDIFDRMASLIPFNENEMLTYRSLFFDFCILGGMPAVVRQYIESSNFSGSLGLQRQILLDYEEDVRKYTEGLDQTRIISVLRSVPSQLAKENKKFQFSHIDKKARSREYSGCIEWLSDAGVISICRCLKYPELPLKGNIDADKFKLYYPDTGILIASLDDEAQDDLRANKNLSVYKGALYENFIAEAFTKQELGLYYYKRENPSLEMDFFVRDRESLIPVEVKSNTNSSRSLTSLIKNEIYSDIKYGIKLSAGNVGFSDNIYTFPFFCAFMIKRFLSEKE